jgi:hypothetical protein
MTMTQAAYFAAGRAIGLHEIGQPADVCRLSRFRVDSADRAIDRSA